MKVISPIRISPNGRYFVNQDGAPVFWLGDTQWELFRQCTMDQALRILRDRQAKGFNVILIMLTGVDHGAFDPNRPAPYTNLDGELPWVDGDPLRPNEAYFRRVDDMIRLGEQTGQTFVVGVYHQWHAGIITLEKARAWARWVARRYRDVPNLIWSMYPRAEPGYMPVCRELAAGLQEGDGGTHLISVHPDPSVASSSFMHDEEWLAFNMIQTCVDYDRIHEAVTADFRRAPAKPVVMAEGGYEGGEFGKLQTAHHIRKQAYWTQLAGGHHVYGHNEAWQAPRSFEAWIDAPGSRHLRVFKDIITAQEGWWDLIPDQMLFAGGAGSGYSLNVAARSADGRWAMVYLSEPSTVTLRLEPIAPNGRVVATWVNPASGDRMPAGNHEVHGVVSFTCPSGWEDAVLLVEADSSI